MTMDMYIVLAVTAFMIIMFVINKVPYGVITMSCCAILALTGVMGASEAFSGLANKTTLLIAGVYALAGAFSKTSLVNRIRRRMTAIKGKNGMVLLICLYGITIILAQLMGRTAVLSIIIMFVQTMDDSDALSPTRLVTGAFSVLAAWSLKIPIALGATYPATMNAYYEGIISDSAMMIQTIDFFKVSIIPCVALTLFALLGWKLIPTQKLDSSSAKEVKETVAIPKRDEIIISIIFVAVMVSFFFGSQIGDLMYVTPAVGVLLLLYTKTLSVKEAVTSMTGDMIWMIAGVLTVSDAIGKSGVGDLIGRFIETILGGTTNGLFVLAIFTIAAVVMTTFMSNTGTAAILTPIAASYALVSGADPRGIVLAINMAAILAIAFPSGSSECALMFATTGHSPIKLLKYTFPYLVIAVVTLVFSANLFYPVFP